MEAQRHVAQLDYAGICHLAPRHAHWVDANDEVELRALQRKAAIEVIFKSLCRSACQSKAMKGAARRRRI